MDELWLRYGIIMKAAGILFTGAGAAGIGVSMAMRYKERLRLLEEMLKIIALLKGEILYANEPLQDAFFHIGERKDSPLGLFFSNMGKRMEKKEGLSFYEMWVQEVGKLEGKTALSKEDLRQMKGFGENLGYLDRSMQERTLLLYQGQLEGEIAYLKEHLQEKNRLYASLGIAAGLFLIIVMC